VPPAVPEWRRGACALVEHAHAIDLSPERIERLKLTGLELNDLLTSKRVGELAFELMVERTQPRTALDA